MHVAKQELISQRMFVLENTVYILNRPLLLKPSAYICILEKIHS